VKEYVNVQIKIEFENENITKYTKSQILDDILYGTLYSDQKFHQFITKSGEKIIPKIKNNNILKTLKDGINNKRVRAFILKYIKENEILKSRMAKENITIDKSNCKIVIDCILNGVEYGNKSINEWIIDNSNTILKEFNKSNCIDLDKELDENPYIFIKHMLHINQELEKSNSRKKYQVIPIRTNFTPKFIPINVHSFVDMLDSKYLLKNIKNYYHDQTDRGIILFETYFNFSCNFIKKSMKKGYIFSGLIQTNGHEIIYHFHSNEHAQKKANYHKCGNNEKKLLKEIKNSDKTDSEKAELLEKHLETKRTKLEEKKLINKEKTTLKKKANKEKTDKIKEETRNKAEKLKNDYDNSVEKLIEKYEEEIIKIKNEYQDKNLIDELKKKCNEDYESDLAYLTHCYNRALHTLETDHENNIKEEFKKIEDKMLIIDEVISIIRNDINKLKQEKKNTNISGNIDNKYIPSTTTDSKKIDKKVLCQIVRILNKITKTIDSMTHEPEDKKLTINHMLHAQITSIKYFIKINKLDKLNELENFSDELDTKYGINNDKTNDEVYIKKMMDCITSVELTNIMTKLITDVRKLKKHMKSQNKKANNKLRGEIKLKDIHYNYGMQILNDMLNDSFIEKKRIENELFGLFKTDRGEFMKVDNMSKKYFEVLDKLNWTVIDPGMNSIFT